MPRHKSKSFLLPLVSAFVVVALFTGPINLDAQTPHSDLQVVEGSAALLAVPCTKGEPEKIYLFLDCNDVRRIRREVNAGDQYTRRAWTELLNQIRLFRGKFPTAYDQSGIGVLWWGAGHYMARDLALAYLVTGKADYASDIVRLLDLVSSQTPAGTLFIRPNHGGVNYEALIFAYTVIRDTPLLTDERRAYYDTFFVDQAMLLEGMASAPDFPPPSGINQNVPFAIDVGIATMALGVPGDPRSAGLYNNAWGRIAQRLATRFDTDGGWYEKTDNYSSIVLEALLIFAESVLRIRGENLYQANFGGRSIHAMCEWYLREMTPQGTMAALNDGLWAGLEPGLLRLCATRTSDPTLTFAFARYFSGYLSSNGRSYVPYFTPFGTVAWADRTLPASEPSWSSVLMPSTGLAILRSSWKADAQYLLLQFTDTTVHQHYSFGNIVLYDNGPWILDNGYHLDNSVSLGSEHDRSMQTSEHSTVSLDGANQTFMGGTPSIFSVLDQSAMVSVSAATYPGFRHSRTVLWAKPTHQWLVIDDASHEAGGSHALQLRWFVAQRGSGAGSHWTFARGGSRLQVDLLPGNLPAEISPVARQYTAFTEGNANGVQMQVIASTWPVRLVSVLTASPLAPIVTRTDSESGMLVSVTQSPKIWNWIVPRSFPGGAQVGATSVTGKAGGLVTTLRGQVLSYCLFDGQIMTSGDSTLASVANPNVPVSLEVVLDARRIVVSTAQPVTLSLFWPGRASRITDETGAPVAFSIADKVMSLQVAEGQHTLQVQP
jgi:hypothetical protein